MRATLGLALAQRKIYRQRMKMQNILVGTSWNFRYKGRLFLRFHCLKCNGRTSWEQLTRISQTGMGSCFTCILREGLKWKARSRLTAERTCSG